MSPRTDHYLTLCLDEATKSPLHYRHGCVVVRGGKVIGQGYNDYRRGFDGGALKSGRLASAGGLNAVLSLKQRKPGTAKVDHGRSTHSMGLEHLASSPLSMLSEMMAIYSALSLSSILSSASSGRATSLLQKPYTKLQGRGKRQLRLQALEGYVNSVCGKREADGKGIVARGKVESTKQNVRDKEEGKDREDEEKKVRVSLKNGTEKDRKKSRCGKCQGSPGRQQQQQQQQQEQRRAHEIGGDQHKCDMADSIMSSRHAARGTAESGRLSSLTESRCNDRKGRNHVVSATAVLVPQVRTGSKSRPAIDRKRDSRLQGSDLYVARLGWGSRSHRADDMALQVARQESETLPTAEPSTETGDRHVSAGSLHDELLDIGPRSQGQKLKEPDKSSAQSPVISASHPCYRCISMAASVGIRRMFWTNAEGEWDGGKVRDLVDALELAGPYEMGGSECGLSGGAGGKGVFVTKHEVLMLRGMMGS